MIVTERVLNITLIIYFLFSVSLVVAKVVYDMKCYNNKEIICNNICKKNI